MRVLVVLALFGSIAHADAPTKKVARKAAEAWIRALGPNPTDATPMTSDPFVFDHDSDTCKTKKKAKDLLACLASDTMFEVGTWAPDRVRIHTDAKFLTWQPNRKRDVIEKHRKELARLKDHVFVHFDTGSNDGAWEMLVAVKLDKDGNPVVDAYLANFLPTFDKHIDANAAIAVASRWARAMAESEDTRKSNASRCGYPFWEIGLPTGSGCKIEQKAATSREMAAISTCVGASDQLDLLDHLPHGSWEVVDDPAAVKTRADKQSDHFAAALDRLDRLAYDHVFLYNRATEEDVHFEILLALRNDDGNPVVDAVVANVY